MKTWHSLPEYQALRALMDSGTTSKAAVRLGLSQSAISRSIASLETRLGRILFERDGGRLRPTSEAAQLNRRLDPLFEALDRIEGPPVATQETLRIIAPPTYAHRFLVNQLTGFQITHPQTLVSLEVATSEDVIRGVQEQRFDIGLIGTELAREGVSLTPYRLSNAVCALPRDHPLAGADEIRPRDLHDQPLIALTHRHARRGQLDKLLTRSRVVPRVVAETSTSFSAVAMAQEGMGLAVINPFPVLQERWPNLVFRAFASPIEYRSYFAASDDRPASGIARAFMRHLRLHTPRTPFTRKP
ncbi:LysR substrate-binding domain-containing protein [Sulfitobacter sp. S190]|uniref:LysR substrate-binding domain-containing protein n=1 Tax=Sulfitobacter sp. S190 TaxID=2867022 RepID=UPI0021A4C4D1|nr:LysR substrate-binding domain-containing protein [Sulfitobacter sp. S190]UWR21138.1 LysR family transcriptional regulator [Sulfitobacter sp. S190]